MVDGADGVHCGAPPEDSPMQITDEGGRPAIEIHLYAVLATNLSLLSVIERAERSQHPQYERDLR